MCQSLIFNEFKGVMSQQSVNGSIKQEVKGVSRTCESSQPQVVLEHAAKWKPQPWNSLEQQDELWTDKDRHTHTYLDTRPISLCSVGDLITWWSTWKGLSKEVSFKSIQRWAGHTEEPVTHRAGPGGGSGGEMGIRGLQWAGWCLIMEKIGLVQWHGEIYKQRSTLKQMCWYSFWWVGGWGGGGCAPWAACDRRLQCKL